MNLLYSFGAATAAPPSSESPAAQKAKAAASAAIDKLDQLATSSKVLTYSLLAIAVAVGIIGAIAAIRRLQRRFQERLSPQFKHLDRVVVAPYQAWLAIATLLVILDLMLLNLQFLPDWGSYVEIAVERVMLDEEKALIRQIILNSTSDIFGIDSRSTDVTFSEMAVNGNVPQTQAQINSDQFLYPWLGGGFYGSAPPIARCGQSKY